MKEPVDVTVFYGAGIYIHNRSRSAPHRSREEARVIARSTLSARILTHINTSLIRGFRTVQEESINTANILLLRSARSGRALNGRRREGDGIKYTNRTECLRRAA